MKRKKPAMKVTSVTDAKAQLSVLLDVVESGGEVLITRRGHPAARLVPCDRSRSPLGAMKGEFKVVEGWERPLTENEADAFYRGEWQ